MYFLQLFFINNHQNKKKLEILQLKRLKLLLMKRNKKIYPTIIVNYPLCLRFCLFLVKKFTPTNSQEKVITFDCVFNFAL